MTLPYPQDHSQAVELISNHLPDPRQAGLEPLGQGDFCLAFRQGPRVVRVARHAEAAAALRREACALAELAPRLPLPVPRLTFFSPPACPPFTIHEEVIGADLTLEAWESLRPPAQDRAAADLAGFLKALHSLPMGPVLDCGLPVLDAAAWAARLRQSSGEAGRLLDQQTRRRLDALLGQWSQAAGPPDQHPALLHCDIAPGHLLYDPRTGRLTGVIDFGDLAIGDPARDLIYVYEDYGQVILEQVLRHYTGAAAPAMLGEIRKWYLLETLSWTVERIEQGTNEEAEEGLEEIRREVAGLG